MIRALQKLLSHGVLPEANAKNDICPLSQRRDPFPRPWRCGHSTTNYGEVIFDANGELVILVLSVSYSDDERKELQKLIVDSVNKMARLVEFFRDPDGNRKKV
jgi:hypothetical protein